MHDISGGIAVAAQAGKAPMPSDGSFDRSRQIREMWRNPELRERIMDGLRRSWQDPDKRAARIVNYSRRPRSPEVRAKISAAQIGKHRAALTVECKEKLRQAMKGRKFSDESKAKMSIAMKGKAKSPAHVAKMAACVRALWATPDYRAKMCAARQRQWADKEYRDQQVAAMRLGCHKRPTGPEKVVMGVLDKHFPGEWKYTGNGEVIIGGKNPDFINVNGKKAVIEVFGDYWHGERRTGKPDAEAESERIALFARYGFRCAVIWERETKDVAEMERKIASLGRG